MNVGDVLYRATGNVSCRYDFADGEYSTAEVEFDEWRVARLTPRGYWVVPDGCWHHIEYGWLVFGKDWPYDKRFILDGSRRRWAYPTREQAAESFLIRKQRQIGHLERQLESARQLLAEAEKTLANIRGAENGGDE